MTASPIDAGVIEAARRRQRRRRLRIALVVSILGAVVVLLMSSRGGDRPRGAARHAIAVPAARLLAKPAYAGVACGVPNSISCDRLGLEVWLRRPAASVQATVAGQAMVLDDPLWSGPQHAGGRTAFAGFMRPAGLAARFHLKPSAAGRWFGPVPRPVPLTVLVRYGDGSVATATTTVAVAPGWG